MTISALLSPQNIFIDTDVTSKKKLLELIANIVADRTSLGQSSIYNSLLNRERLGVIRFYPEGGSSGGGIDMERADGTGVRISVDWLVGRVSQETYVVNQAL